MINAQKTRLMVLFMLFVTMFLLTGCSEDSGIVNNTATSDKEALLNVVEGDPDIQSFEPNYDEGAEMTLMMGKVDQTVYPIRFRRNMKLISRDIEMTVAGDTAIGKVTKVFEGTLTLALSYDEAAMGDTSAIDTTITKTFTSTVTSMVIFEKRPSRGPQDDSTKQFRDWRVKAMSLPEGGTATQLAEIKKVEVFFANNDSLSITDPNSYFIGRDKRMRKQIPNLNRGEASQLRVTVVSAVADTDMVVLNFGRHIKGGLLGKRRLTMVSSIFNGTAYEKVYTLDWTTNQFPGSKHAIISVMPMNVLTDNATAVTSNAWGIPYIVKP